MDGFAIIAVPLLAIWGLSVDYRCINADWQKRFHTLTLCSIVVLSASIVFGSIAVVVAFCCCVAEVIAVEAMLALNKVPASRNYQIFFQHLPFDLKVLAPGGKQVYRTDGAREEDPSVLRHLAKSASESDFDGVLTLRSDTDPTCVYKLYKLFAGTALLTEDASELVELQHELENRRDFLLDQNEVLGHVHAMRSLSYRQQRERELSDRVERDLAATATRIRELLNSQMPGDGGGSHASARRVEQLNSVKVLVAYAKRKGMLALTSAESATMSREQVEVMAREAMADLGSIGVDCAVLVSVAGDMDVLDVSALYDSFYDCVMSVLPYAGPVLMVSIAQDESGILELRASIECAIGLEPDTAAELIPRRALPSEGCGDMQMRIARDLEQRLSARELDYSVRADEGFVYVCVKTAKRDRGVDALDDSAPGVDAS